MDAIKKYMAKRLLLTMLVGALLLIPFHPASAQRTSSGQSSCTLSCSYNGTSVSAEAFYQQYTLNGFWEAGIMGADYSAPLRGHGALRYDDLSAAGGYAFRLAATRSRSLNWYAGAGVFAGIEYLDPLHRLPSYLDLGRSQLSFLYGVYARTTLEIFLGMRVALLVQASLPVNFSSGVSHWHYNVGGGIKFLFN